MDSFIDSIAAYIFAGLTTLTVLFQLALAAGAPWGSYAMGGKYPGVFPAPLRVSAVVQAALLIGFAFIALARVGAAFTALESMSQWAMWVVVGFSTVAFVLNSITPSKPERMIWAPITFVMLVCSVVVAL